MNIKNLITLVFVLAIGMTLYAQKKLSKLEAPSSPASHILGMQPSAVLNPKSYQTLETALFSNFVSENDFVLPNDFALEFTPYWTKNHGLSITEYLYPENAIDQLVRNASFSLASTQNFKLGDDMNSNALAFGFRTTFYVSNKADREKTKADLQTIYNASSMRAVLGSIIAPTAASSADLDTFWLNFQNKLTEKIVEYTDNGPESAAKLSGEIRKESKNLTSYDQNNTSQFIQELMDIIYRKTDGETAINAFEDYMKKRYGLSIDVAYAAALNFPTKKFDFSYLPRQSVWVTPNYRFKDNLDFLKIAAVFRYEWYFRDFYTRYFPNQEVFENNIDYGLELESQFKRFSISFEAVGRSANSQIPAGTDVSGNELFRKDSDSDFQYIGTFSYNITESIIVSYSFGNRFETIENSGETLVSLLGLNFGFGAPTSDDIDTAKSD
ncbi:MAG: hypothetical protein HKN48_08585 [Flavobacteriaceae bacterium]|nr:hypothetical protein [Flavobacteriaceae bacterium]